MERLKRLARQFVRRLGYNLIQQHYAQPMPLVDQLPASLWPGPTEMVGVDLQLPQATALLGRLQPYLDEFRPPLTDEGNGFWLHNTSFAEGDADTLYAMLRHLRPGKVYELGSGSSSHVIDMARGANDQDGKTFAHTIFDPFPFTVERMGPVAEASVIEARTEDLPVEWAAELDPGDVLFVDTSHTVRTGGDVTHLFRSLLPRLAVGVHVHFHDIFLPYEYPREWVVGEERRAWAEHYLLQAFLTFNPKFEVVLPLHALAREAPDLLRQRLRSFRGPTQGSFWITRTVD